MYFRLYYYVVRVLLRAFKDQDIEGSIYEEYSESSIYIPGTVFSFLNVVYNLVS
jgi:hypothetical protein